MHSSCRWNSSCTKLQARLNGSTEGEADVAGFVLAYPFCVRACVLACYDGWVDGSHKSSHAHLHSRPHLMSTGNDSLDQRFWRLSKKFLMHRNGGLVFWWLKVQCFRICWCKCSKFTTTSAKALTAHRMRCCCMLSQPSSCHSDRQCTATQLAPHGCL